MLAIIRQRCCAFCAARQRVPLVYSVEIAELFQMLSASSVLTSLMKLFTRGQPTKNLVHGHVQLDIFKMVPAVLIAAYLCVPLVCTEDSVNLMQTGPVSHALISHQMLSSLHQVSHTIKMHVVGRAMMGIFRTASCLADLAICRRVLLVTVVAHALLS